MRLDSDGRPFRTRVITFPHALRDRYLLHGNQQFFRSQFANTAWPSAGRAVFFPFELDRSMLATEMWVLNGFTTLSANWDVGLYTADGVRLANLGGVAQAGSSVIQAFDIPDTLLGRGVYYAALVSSGASPIYAVGPGATADYLCWGAFQQDSAYPLPATMTPVTNTTPFAPLFGIAGRHI
jgi:hypothetical protein